MAKIALFLYLKNFLEISIDYAFVLSKMAGAIAILPVAAANPPETQSEEL